MKSVPDAHKPTCNGVWGGFGWDRMGSDGIRWDRIGPDRDGWGGAGVDGVEWDGTECWDGVGWVGWDWGGDEIRTGCRNPQMDTRAHAPRRTFSKLP